MGTNDGGRTVLNNNPRLDECTAQSAMELGLRAHIVGGKLVWEKHRDEQTGKVVAKARNVGGKVLYAAADVEGHDGADSR